MVPALKRTQKNRLQCRHLSLPYALPLSLSPSLPLHYPFLSPSTSPLSPSAPSPPVPRSPVYLFLSFSCWSRSTLVWAECVSWTVFLWTNNLHLIHS